MGVEGGRVEVGCGGEEPESACATELQVFLADRIKVERFKLFSKSWKLLKPLF